MSRVNLGTNDFFGVPFPVVVADRFFHIYEDEGMKIDVFRWDENSRTAVYEVLRSKPLQENISSNPTGIVTFGSEDGAFLFKFRPKPGISNIFGKIPSGEEVVVEIRDSILEIRQKGALPGSGTTLTRNQFSGFPIGIRVEVDGSIGIGVNWLPDGLELSRAS